MSFRGIRTAAVYAAFLFSVGLAPCVVLALPISNQLELTPGDGQISISLVDDQRSVVYLGVTDDDGLSSLIRVEKDGLSRDETIPLGSVEFRSAVISADGGSAYFGLAGNPGRILQVDLDDFSLTGELTLPLGHVLLPAALSGSSGDAVYFALRSPGRILRVDTATFEVSGTLELEERETGFSDAVLAPDGRYAYWAANYIGAFFYRTTTIVKIDLHSFERVDSIRFLASPQRLERLFMDPEGKSLWAWGRWSPTSLIRINLDQFEVVDELEFPQGVAWVNAAVMEASGKRAVFAGGAEPPTVLRVDLQSMQLMDNVLLDDENLAALSGGVASTNQPSVYFLSANEPARLVELDIRKPYLRFTPAALDLGQTLAGFPALPHNARLDNTGGAPAESLQFQDMQPTLNLAGHDCPSQLEPGAGCDLTILFEATSPGPNSEMLWALSSTAAAAQLELHVFGQDSVAMAVTDYGLGPEWFYGDFMEFSKPVMQPVDSMVQFWVNDASQTVSAAFDSDSLEWMQGFGGLWDARTVDTAISHDGSAVYLAIEEHDGADGALAKITTSAWPLVLHPTGNRDPVSVVQASASEDRVWFTTGSELARLFEVDADEFIIVDELQVSTDGGVDSAALNETGNSILLALNTNPVRITEVSLTDFDVTRELELPLIDGRLKTALIDSDAGYAYFVSTSIPAEVVSIALDSLSLAGSLELETVVGQVTDGELDAASRRAYLLGDGPDGVTLTRLDLEDLLADALVRLGPDFHSPGGVAITVEGDYALIPAKLDGDRGAIIRMRLNAAELRFEPANVDFGETEQFGPPKSAEVWLHNDGGRVASMLHFYLPSAHFVLSSSECPAALPPGESCRMEISLNPEHAGEGSGVLHVHSEDGAPALLTMYADVKLPVFRDRFEFLD